METTTEVAEMHYRAVIRAYVAEALELSQFLKKVATNRLHESEKTSTATDNAKHGSTSLHELDKLGFNDWVSSINKDMKYILFKSLSGLTCCLMFSIKSIKVARNKKKRERIQIKDQKKKE